MIIQSAQGWEDYELLDSGDGRKLERYGKYLLDRPDPQALWKKHSPQSTWSKANAIFEKVTSDSGRWVKKDDVSALWPLKNNGISFYAGLTPFKHTGVFPEQVNHWHWISKQIESRHQPVSLLNLFGYTGIASLFAAAAGAEVVHVDSSHKSLAWARQNQELSKLGQKKIRWILDDALKFAQREVRRGNTYDAIIMDPPVYGHGPSGERWNFDADFPKLIEACGFLLSPNPLFILISVYATTSSAVTIGNVLAEIVKTPSAVEVGELALQEKNSDRLLPAGIYSKWSSAGLS